MENCIVSLGIMNYEIQLELILLAKPIDPVRLKPFYPQDPDKISRMALKVLTDGQECLRIVGMLYNAHEINISPLTPRSQRNLA